MSCYADLIRQTFKFPTEEFRIENNELLFHGLSLTGLIEKYGTPLKLSYLPKISENIQKTETMFKTAMERHGYEGEYTYCYCTKASHFSFVLEEVLKNNVQLETSSAYDLDIVRKLYEKKLIDRDALIVCNGFKRPLYKKYICDLINEGFENCVPVIDNLNELDYYENHCDKPFRLGIRMAADEEPNFEFYTSRLGMRYNDVVDFYKTRIRGKKNVELKMLHFFIHWGISDSAYYWSELSRFIHKYCELKKICPELDTIDIGGGFPVKTSLAFEYDYQYITEQIVQSIKWICDKSHVPVPHIVTEFGTYTVGESGAVLYSVLDEKLQNDKELWYMIDGSFITHIPDSYSLNQKYIMLAVNHWDKPHHRINLGGLTCDSLDYYNSEAHSSDVFLPKKTNEKPLYIGFFHTGAYQEAIGGYGGLQHCLIPAPKHIIIRKDPEGNITDEVFRDEQGSTGMLSILGY